MILLSFFFFFELSFSISFFLNKTYKKIDYKECLTSHAHFFYFLSKIKKEVYITNVSWNQMKT